MIAELSITITNNLYKEPKEATYNRKRRLTQYSQGSVTSHPPPPPPPLQNKNKNTHRHTSTREKEEMKGKTGRKHFFVYC